MKERRVYGWKFGFSSTITPNNRNMSSSKLLSNLKAAQLKHAAFLTGLPMTGTKLELESSLEKRIRESSPFENGIRIVSLDMGIKNLGLCVLDAPHLANQGRTAKHSPNRPWPLKVIAWKKIDVLDLLRSNIGVPPDQVAGEDPYAPAEGRQKQKTSTRHTINAAAFYPSVLSRAALTVSQDILRTYRPNQILIERQRFRSGGASAVQEWTLRVNMLESMLWACLETMRDGHDPKDKVGPFPSVHEISPARVAKFWCGDLSEYGTKVAERLLDELPKGSPQKTGAGIQEHKRKIEKKDKIAVVRSWLSPTTHSEDRRPKVVLDFADEAQVVADTFLPNTKGSLKKRGDAKVDGPEKLDDLADCLLQSVAWVRWEENRRILGEMVDPAQKGTKA